MSRSENLPVIPQSLSAIIQMSESDFSMRSIEKVLERDPSVSTKILKVANSTYYGAGSVQSIGRAIQVLGSSGIKSVVTSLAMQSIVAGNSYCSRFNRVDYWKHSLATAVCCRILGRLKMPQKAEELYAAGLMHDVGLIIMDRFMPGELDVCLEESAISGLPLHYVEQERLGYSHADVGAALTEKWKFSPLIVSAIKNHHQQELDAESFKATMAVHLADSFAHEAGYDNSQIAGLHNIDDYFLTKMEISEENAKVIEQVTVVEVERATEAFQAAA
ncbi:MAG: HDOD domain-containing protein [Armatimonadota bacterium]